MLAVALSLAAAAAFAASAMLINSVSGRVGPLQLSRWQMSLAFLMTAVIALATGGWRSLDLLMVLWLTASSASGIMIGSLTYIATIQFTGPPHLGAFVHDRLALRFGPGLWLSG